ncbi:MAG: PHP domain-containing protein [Candidatus Bathyarchaeia archaeon]
MIKLDLHVHTLYSGDAEISPKQIVEQINAHPFIKGVAITDHDTLEGYFQARKLATSYKDIAIVPGIEVTTKQGHLIILGIEEEPKRPITAGETVDFAHQKGGIIIIPHPYREMGLGDLAETLPADAIEVLNPTVSLEKNKMASTLAKVRNLPGVAGSDAHRIQELWMAYTEVDAQTSVDDILKAIRRGLLKVVSSRYYGV